MAASWFPHFLTSTRGRLIAMMRRAPQTVEDMASALQLTDNAVRAQLTTLERDGFVRQTGVRRGVGAGKPAYTYALTAEAEQLFPKPYAEVLNDLLDALTSQSPALDVEGLLRDVGRRLAQGFPAGEGNNRARLEAAIAALNQLGGLAELEESDNDIRIHGYSCPVAALIPGHPQACQLAEAFVSEVAGVPVRERCDRSGAPHCSFELLT